MTSGQNHGVLPRNGELLDAADHFPDKRVGDTGDDDPDGIGAARNQAAGDGADPIALLGGNLLDELARLGVHQRTIA